MKRKEAVKGTQLSAMEGGLPGELGWRDWFEMPPSFRGSCSTISMHSMAGSKDRCLPQGVYNLDMEY